MTHSNDNKFNKSVVTLLKVVAAVCLSAVVLAPIVYYVKLLVQNDKIWLDKLYIIFLGVAAAFVLSLLFDTPHRRLLVNMFKGMRVALNWDAGNMFMKIVLVILLLTYGSIFVVCVSALYSSVSIWIWPWQNKQNK